jgi:hypothetical protein
VNTMNMCVLQRSNTVFNAGHVLSNRKNDDFSHLITDDKHE